MPSDSNTRYYVGVLLGLALVVLGSWDLLSAPGGTDPIAFGVARNVAFGAAQILVGVAWLGYVYRFHR